MDNPSLGTRTENPWEIFRQHYRLILGLTLACAVGSGIFSLLQMKIYRTSTYLLLSESKVEATQSTIPNYVYYEILRSYETFIANDSMILKILEKFALQNPPYSLTVEEFRKRKILEVEWSKNTRLLEVSAEFPDPRLAAEIVNFFVANAVRFNEELNAQDLQKAQAFFREQLSISGQKLESAKKDLLDFDQISNLEILRQSLSDLQELNSRNQGELTRLEVERARTVAKKDALLSESKNDQGDSRIKAGGIETTSPSPRSEVAESGSRAEMIRDKVVETSAELAGIDAAIQTLKNALESNRKVLSHLQKEKAFREDRYSQLTDEYETAQSNYESFARKYQEVPLAVGARSTELKAIAPAIPPTKPYKPWIALNMILGGLLGFLLSLPLSLFVRHLESSGQSVQGLRTISADRGSPDSKDQSARSV
jgi:uncharacterized protein involved in exopolysaccharide biosynthesis